MSVFGEMSSLYGLVMIFPVSNIHSNYYIYADCHKDIDAIFKIKNQDLDRPVNLLVEDFPSSRTFGTLLSLLRRNPYFVGHSVIRYEHDNC